MINLEAVKFIKAIEADSKPIVVRAADGFAYVTKWIFARGENRRLINEWLSAAVMLYMGVNCAENAIVHISAAFIKSNRNALKAAFGADFENIVPGPVFASRIDESAEPVRNQPLLAHVVNLEDFWSALVADVFLCQGDKRQAIFEKAAKHQYRAKFIDNANALESVWWQFKTAPNAVYVDKSVYRDLTFAQIEPLILKLSKMPRAVLTDAFELIPQEWLVKDRGHLEHVMKILWQRQRNMQFLMARFLQGDNSSYFPVELVNAFAAAKLGRV